MSLIKIMKTALGIIQFNSTATQTAALMMIVKNDSGKINPHFSEKVATKNN